MEGNFTKTILRLIFSGIFIILIGTSTIWSQIKICSGDSAVLNLTGYSGTFQWQESPDSITWTDIPNATKSSFTIKPVSSIYFRAKVTIGTCPLFYSNIKQIIVNQSPVVDAGRDTFMCNGSVMTLGGNPTANGGTPPYSYSWGPGVSLNSTTMANPTSFANSTTIYKVEVTDANGCKVSDQMILGVSSPPTSNAGKDTAICSGSSVKIGGSPTGSGGMPPYRYSWNPFIGLNDPAVANPVATHSVSVTTNIVYTVKVTDSFGCISTDVMNLRVGAELYADAGKDTGMCIGQVLTIGGVQTGKGGTPPYQYLWTPSTGLSNNKIANPTTAPNVSTNYALLVTDAMGCTARDTIKIKVASVPVPEAGPDKVICKGSNVNIGGTPPVTGGTPPFYYTWSPNSRLSNYLATNPNAFPITTTRYKLTVIDYYRCTASDSMLLTVGTPTVEAGKDTVICKNSTITIGGSPTASGSKSPYTYIWTPSTGLSATNIPNPSATPLITTKYKVTVMDFYNCPSSDSFTLTVGTATVNAGTDKNLCNGSSVSIGATPVASGSKQPYTYLWSPSTALSSTTVANPVANPVVTTVYIITVTDAYGCISRDTMTVNVLSKPIVNAGPDKPWCNNPVTIGGSPTASGGTSPYTYLWTPSTGLSSATVANPTTSVKATQRYIVNVTDNIGCVGRDTMFISGGLIVNAGKDTALGSTGGVITLGGTPTASGGTPPYTYLWTPSTGLNNATIANPVATVTVASTYIVTVTDNSGCWNKDTINIATCTVNHGSTAFSYTGSTQTWTVPVGSCVTSITVTCNGAGGGGTTGGYGGRIIGIVNVTPGETFTIIVGGGGGCYVSDNRAAAGGGGFSGLIQGGVHVISAGGGGGEAGTGGSGYGGGGSGGGSSGAASGGSGGCGTGGSGGSATGGPSGGNGGTCFINGSNGTSSGGGNGSDGTGWCSSCGAAGDYPGVGGGGGYGTTGGTGGISGGYNAYNYGYGGAGGYGGGGAGGGGGWGSGNNRMSAGGGAGGGYNGGAGGSVTYPTSCGSTGGGGGGGGSNYANTTRVTVTSNILGAGSAPSPSSSSGGVNGNISITW